MKQTISKSFLCLFVLLSAFFFPTATYASGYYTHDPMLNPKAAADIIVDTHAVYGYSPNPDSTRLGVYAQYDWSDKVFVAEMKQQREEYHESIKELYQTKATMESEGKSIEEIARAVSIRRNEIRMEAYKDDPEGLDKLKESNLATFGNENGGTPDYFYAKYGSWETVIEKAFSTNAGADACLGLYDKYYDTYIINNPESNTQESTSPTSAESVESTTAKPGTPSVSTIDQSMTSPKTGDDSSSVIQFIFAISGMGTAVVAALIYSMKRE